MKELTIFSLWGDETGETTLPVKLFSKISETVKRCNLRFLDF